MTTTEIEKMEIGQSREERRACSDAEDADGSQRPITGNKNDVASTRARAHLDSLFPGRRLGRVLLVNPPDSHGALFRLDTAKRGRYTNYPPYGLGLLATHLRGHAVTPRIVNLNHTVLVAAQVHDPAAGAFDHGAIWRAALNAAIETFRPDLIAVTCMFTMTHESFRDVCREAAASGVPVAVGGVHVTNDVNRILDDVAAIDIAFLREGDSAVSRFVDVVRGEREPSALRQCLLDTPDGRLSFDAPMVPDLETIDAAPAYDLMPPDDMSRVGTIGAFYCFKPPDARFATVLSNRGCRAQCTFCSVRTFNGKSVRQRSVASVLDELERLRNEHGIDHVMWLDDDLLKDHRRAMDLFEGMVRRVPGLTWDATNGLIASSCTAEMVHAMADSGCLAINIGMESGNPDILRTVKKPGTVQTFLKAAENLSLRPEIHCSVFLMIGFPGETLRMIQDTIDVARRMDMDWYRISPLQPLPGTPIYDSMVAQGLVDDVGSSELRFMGGAYGKQTEIEQGLRDAASADFAEAFAAIPPDAVPDADQITDIWFYMNYHLNFHRLFGEDRPTKIAQQFDHLRILGDVISPENGFALYFTGYLQHRTRGAIDPDVIDRLQARLDSSPYWRDRFAAFGLDVTDLRRAEFRNGETPKLVAELSPDPLEAGGAA